MFKELPVQSGQSDALADDQSMMQIDSLTVQFPNVTRKFARQVAPHVAVDDLSLYIRRGETLGLVGESGCGKTTLSRTIVGLYRSTSGSIKFRGKNLTNLPPREFREMRRHLQIVYQDPYASLNPRLSIEDTLCEPLEIHRLGTKSDRQARLREMLSLVGLSSKHLHRYPHEFSGGQRQRIGIARALITRPQFVICDEAVSALDVSIQAQVLNLFQDLKDQIDLTYLFISHDLGVVRHVSDRIAVMFSGQIVELAPSEVLFGDPRHPYTRTLLAAMSTQNLGLGPEHESSGMERIADSTGVPGSLSHQMKRLVEVQPDHWVLCEVEPS